MPGAAAKAPAPSRPTPRPTGYRYDAEDDDTRSGGGARGRAYAPPPPPTPAPMKSRPVEPPASYAPPTDDGDADDRAAAPELRRSSQAAPTMPGGSPKKEASEVEVGFSEEKRDEAQEPEQPSMFERAKRKVKGFLGSRTEEAKPEPIQKDVADKKEGALSLQGRIVSRTDDGEMVIEVRLITGVELVLSNAKVSLRLADGSVEEAEIVLDRSTREGTLSPGAVFRLVVRRKGTATERVTSCRVTLEGLTIDAS